MPDRPHLTDLLRDHVLVADGAMGTMLYARGVPLSASYDALNLSDPEIVRSVHRAYLEAGADLIQTNTFGANRTRLRRHALEDRTGEINRRGAELARQEAGEGIIVAGSVGPLAVRVEPLGPTSLEEARDLFIEQIEPLVAGGVDCLMLETFSDLNQITSALTAARQVTDLPVVAQMTCGTDGNTLLGVPPETFGAVLDEAGADVIGVNHSDGPAAMLEVVERLRAVTDRPLCAQPNAGVPKNVEGRNIYLVTPDYLARYAILMVRAGVSIVGGCCGTTPEHIRAIRQAIRSLTPARPPRPPRTDSGRPAEREPVPEAQRSELAGKLDRGEWIVCVELTPPRSSDPTELLEGARVLRESGVDAINVPDGPRASARMSAVATALLLTREVGIEPVLHYTCRDRNLVAMQSDLLGFDALGLHNLLVVTGDPPRLGDYPDATAVYDVDSIGLTNVIRMLNSGRDLGGKDLGRSTALFHGVGCNPCAVDPDGEMRRFWYKVDAGACFVMTQPVFDVHRLEVFLEQISGLDGIRSIPVIAGIWPLLSLRNAEFLHNEIPGVSIPGNIMARMAAAGDGERARAEGVAIAREILDSIRPLVRGVQISAPLGSYRQVLAVLA